jgi:TIR domain
VSGRGDLAGHVFISYAREDAQRVDQLQRTLKAAGIPVWRDTADLWPGEDWHAKIRGAITANALVFIACFSRASLARGHSYQNEELTLAIDQMRLRRPDDPWLIPVRFDECDIPDRDIGGGRTLRSIQRVDLFGEGSDDSSARLVEVVQWILRGSSDAAAPGSDREPDRSARFASPQRKRPGLLRTWLRDSPTAAAWVGALAAVASVVVAVVAIVLVGHGASSPSQPATPSGTPTSTAPRQPMPGSPVVPAGPWKHLAASSWISFGVADVSSMHGGIMQVAFHQPLSLANKWAGTIAKVAPSCHYTFEMQARVVSQVSRVQGGGYGIASGQLAGSEPSGPAFQYDFGFDGYRVLTYPLDFSRPYIHRLALLDHRWHDVRIVVSDGIRAYVDGRFVMSRSSATCGRPIIRVWAATADFRDMRIQQDI